MKQDTTISELEELYKNCKIDWTNFYIEMDECLCDSEITFEIMPEDFLRFAKNNLKVNNIENCINAMSNAKRAIESQIDLLIKTIGYDFKKFNKKNSYIETKKFIKLNYNENNYNGITPKIKLLNILGLAPTLIISEIRKLRNRLEHEYIAPAFKETKKAVEVAELFLNSSNRKLSYSLSHMAIANKKSSQEYVYGYERYNLKPPFIKIVFNNKVNFPVVEIGVFNELDMILKNSIKPEDKFYIELIYSLLNEDCTILPKIFGHDIDKKYVNWSW